jgi:hypothetical protein
VILPISWVANNSSQYSHGTGYYHAAAGHRRGNTIPLLSTLIYAYRPLNQIAPYIR